MNLTLTQPYPFLGLTIKEHYLRELEEKSAKHIYFHYEGDDGKKYMKQIPYLEAVTLIESM